MRLWHKNIVFVYGDHKFIAIKLCKSNI